MNNTLLLETPEVLRGFDVKEEDMVISLSNGEKELWVISQKGTERLCRGFLPLFLGDDILYVDAQTGDRTDIFLYRKDKSSNLTTEGRNLAPQPSPD
ncbi:MAG: hypothetical protein HXS46_16920 [Theionarchaea archaeon]|nr:hypothetical protein [Theionarchaea archaeon]